MKTHIAMRLVNHGVHRWPNQTKYPELAELHHHNFVILIEFEETGSREIEFCRFRASVAKNLASSFGNKLWNFGDMSCEDTAITVAARVRALLEEDRQIAVTVWEDEEGCAGSISLERDEKIEDEIGSKGVDRQKDSGFVV